MSPLPLPVRIAAGLAVTAVEQARKLPEQIVGLPLTAASRAVQTGMRVQQQITQLAIKGDAVFALFAPVHEEPSWARFDEDVDDVVAPDHGPSDRTPSGSDDVATAALLRLPVHEHDQPDDDRGDDDASDVTSGAPKPTPSALVTATAPTAGPPPALPGYDTMSLAQLRGTLRRLSETQLESLVAHEQAHQDRAPFVTMLSNRITTLRAQ